MQSHSLRRIVFDTSSCARDRLLPLLQSVLQINMKLLVLSLLALLHLCAAQGDGRYYNDDSGRYVHDPNDGRYIHDDTGNYRHDGTGGYKGDGSGQYSGDQNRFGGRFAGSKSQFGKQSSQFQSNLVGSSTFQRPQSVPVRPVAPRQVAPRPQYGNVAAGTTQYSSSTGSGDGRWRILRQSGDNDLDGYQWEYLTENGINAEERGKLLNKGTDREAMEAQGFYTYTGPDGVVYTVKYTAGENGFEAQGDHLPTPPPIPEAILKALDQQRSQG